MWQKNHENLLEQWVDFPHEKGSGTSWASSEEHQWVKGSRDAAIEEPTVLHICFCSSSNNSK